MNDAASTALGLLRFGSVATVTVVTTILLWIAAAGGTLLLLLSVLAGASARWLWVSAPLAWIALFGWRRRQHRAGPRALSSVYSGRTTRARTVPEEGHTMATEEKVGAVTGYYSRIGVAAIHLTDGDLRVGDQIRIRGHTTDFIQTVDSLQVEHQGVQQAERGSTVAVKVRERARTRDQVLRLREG